ncbi:MAG: hypothetical protein KGM24_12245 [Elusimicrobia bacterium]|nr:hypothetical protein [Elusimicrobiota bacterium]
MRTPAPGDALLAVLALVFAVSLALGGPPRFLPPWTALFLLSAAAAALLWRRETRAGREPLLSRPDAALFWLCLTLYLASFRWHGGDDIPNGLLPYCLLRHGTLSFDPYRAWATRAGMVDLIRPVGGRLLSAYPIGAGVAALPLYLIPAAFHAPPTDVFLHNLSKIAGALMTAGSVVCVRRVLVKRCSARWAAACALLYGLGTFCYSVTSQALYSQSLAQLGVALGLWGLVEEGAGWSALAGLGFGLSWAAREDSALFVAAAGLFVLFHERRRLPAFLAGLLPPVLLNFAYWLHYTGTLHPPYFALQAHLFTGFQLSVLADTMLSPSRGLLLFFPAAVFGVWGAAKIFRDPRARWSWYFAGASLAVWLLFAFRSTWTAGNSYGMRYFALAVLPLCLFAGEREREIRDSPRLRAAWTWTFAFCVLVHACGANFRWPGYNWTIDDQLRTVWSARMFPLLQLFVNGGPIDGTPQPWRTLYALALLSLVWLPAAWMRRWLAASEPS